jgi:pyruvate dehydrogenase E1 component alpha subunit
VCENNQWQAYVHRRETMPDGAIASWAQGHGLPTRTLDGNDVEVVREATAEAVAEIRASGRPRFLELVTYRQRGHFEPDDQAYVDAAELATWVERDPIRLSRDRLLAGGTLDSGALTAMEQRVAARIAEASAYAQASPWPSPGTLLDHVYA